MADHSPEETGTHPWLESPPHTRALLTEANTEPQLPSRPFLTRTFLDMNCRQTLTTRPPSQGQGLCQMYPAPLWGPPAYLLPSPLTPYTVSPNGTFPSGIRHMPGLPGIWTCPQEEGAPKGRGSGHGCEHT